MSVVQSGLSAISKTKIKFVDCPYLNGNQAQQGGVFYMNQPNITIHLLNSQISNSRATQTAGVIYIQSGVGFILEDSIIKDVFAPS